MAQRNLRDARRLRQRHPRHAAALGVDAEETAGWRDAADDMFVPFDAALGVHPQAEGFTDHAVWDFEHTPPEQYPLLLHFPYFDLYRKQVVKQADLVLALHLRGDAFTLEEKARNFEYYEQLTVRDSSLSACTQAVIAAEVGHLELAYDYFAEAALMDLRDLEHNTRDGLHMASHRRRLDRRGRWGSAGCATTAASSRFAPAPARGGHAADVPAALPGTPAGRRADAEPRRPTPCASGEPLELQHDGEAFTVDAGAPVTRPITKPPVRPAPSQPYGRAPMRRHRPRPDRGI